MIKKCKYEVTRMTASRACPAQASNCLTYWPELSVYGKLGKEHVDFDVIIKLLIVWYN